MLARDTVSNLRHQLRTALNHIIGYSEILTEGLEEEGSATAASKPLQEIVASARQILDLIQSHLPSQAEMGEADFTTLCDTIAPLVHNIVRKAGLVAQDIAPAQTMDLLRIGTAAAEILAFIQSGPVADRQTRRREPALVRTSMGPAGRVLVVDDNEANRDMLTRQLLRHGHEVDCAENGRNALLKAQNRAFDLILLDVLMPETSGLTVLQNLKASPELGDIPVIMISAMDDLQPVAHCLEAGADDYLTKPIEPVLMYARVSASLERKRLRDRERDRARDLERALEQVNQSYADLNHFAYAVSHDLQEPLRTMTSYAQLLLRRYSGRLDADADSFLNFIAGSGVRMRNFILDLLEFSKLSTAAQPSMDEHVDSEAALARAMDNLRTLIQESGAEVTAGPLPPVSGNSVEFIQLFQNLIANAIKYRQPGVQPRIRISAEQGPGAWIVSIADNGVGVAPEYVEQIFAPFKRLHGHEIPGTGIGLALCRRIVERHGGRIWVESAGDGAGSTFRFTTPVRE